MRISDWSSDVCSSDLKLRGRIGLGEKDRREIDGEGGIGEPVVPFDQIARRSADDRQQPFARYRLNLHHLPLPPPRSAHILHPGDSRAPSLASLRPAPIPAFAVITGVPPPTALFPSQSL